MADVQLALNTGLMTLPLMTNKPIFINVSAGLVSRAIYAYLNHNHHDKRFGFKDKRQAQDYTRQFVERDIPSKAHAPMKRLTLNS